MDVINNEAERRFEIRQGDGAIAFADYRVQGSKVMFPHTVVPPQHEGKGVGSALARASLDWARAQGLTVIPACSFYAIYMSRHPETHDLLDPGSRTSLGL